MIGRPRATLATWVLPAVLGFVELGCFSSGARREIATAESAPEVSARAPSEGEPATAAPAQPPGPPAPSDVELARRWSCPRSRRRRWRGTRPRGGGAPGPRARRACPRRGEAAVAGADRQRSGRCPSRSPSRWTRRGWRCSRCGRTSPPPAPAISTPRPPRSRRGRAAAKLSGEARALVREVDRASPTTWRPRSDTRCTWSTTSSPCASRARRARASRRRRARRGHPGRARDLAHRRRHRARSRHHGGARPAQRPPLPPGGRPDRPARAASRSPPPSPPAEIGELAGAQPRPHRRQADRRVGRAHDPRAAIARRQSRRSTWARASSPPCATCPPATAPRSRCPCPGSRAAARRGCAAPRRRPSRRARGRPRRASGCAPRIAKALAAVKTAERRVVTLRGRTATGCGARARRHRVGLRRRRRRSARLARRRPHLLDVELELIGARADSLARARGSRTGPRASASPGARSLERGGPP